MDLQEALKKIKDLEKDNKVLSGQVGDLESDKSDLDEAVDKLTANNQKQQKELRSARSKNQDEDGLSDKLNDSEDKVRDLEKLLDTQGKDLKSRSKELETANQSIADKSGLLDKHIIGGGITEALNGLEKHKIRDNALKGVTRDIMDLKPTLVDGVAMIGDKTLKEYVQNDYVGSTGSSIYLTEKTNGGGGAGGGNNHANNNVDRKDMSPEQMMAAGRDNK